MERVICHCIKHKMQRIRSKDELKKYGVNLLSLKDILHNGQTYILYKQQVAVMHLKKRLPNAN